MCGRRRARSGRPPAGAVGRDRARHRRPATRPPRPSRAASAPRACPCPRRCAGRGAGRRWTSSPTEATPAVRRSSRTAQLLALVHPGPSTATTNPRSGSAPARSGWRWVTGRLCPGFHFRAPNGVKSSLSGRAGRPGGRRLSRVHTSTGMNAPCVLASSHRTQSAGHHPAVGAQQGRDPPRGLFQARVRNGERDADVALPGRAERRAGRDDHRRLLEDELSGEARGVVPRWYSDPEVRRRRGG